MTDIVNLNQARERFAVQRAVDERDLSMVAEVERRFAEAMNDVAELGGVSIDYLDRLMRASWGLPESGGAMWPDWSGIFQASRRDVTMPPIDNLYAGGDADGRQSTRAHLEASEVLFRPRYRKLTESEIDLHDRIKTQAAVLAALFYEVEPIHAGPSKNRERGANVQLGIRNLEDAVYRAVKALTGPVDAPADIPVDAVKTDLAADVAAGERKAGIADLPPEQQRQLDEGKPITPAPAADGAVTPAPAGEPVPPPAPPAPPPPPPQAAAEDDEREERSGLSGSEGFPKVIDIAGTGVPLISIVIGAAERNGFGPGAWNDLDQEQRDAYIRQEIRVRTAAAAEAAAEGGQAEGRAGDDGGRGGSADGVAHPGLSGAGMGPAV